MQGKKDYEEKLFINFQLSQRVPKNNFYYRLNEILDLSYLRKQTEKYYGREGQKSIDPVVFFKLMLVGYFENVNSDRKIIEQSSLRLDILYFLGYALDEPLPWHSTLSRTRKLFGEEVFLELFRYILRMCVEKGMVNGRTQAVDSAFIKANASMDSIVEKELQFYSKKYFDEITENEDSGDNGNKENKRKYKDSSKYNEKYVSPSDPDARVSCKRGKIPALNHLGIISVDTENHVICGATVDFADKRDFMTTESIVCQALENLSENGLKVEEVLADNGYGTAESYEYLERENITAYIPSLGQYKPKRDGFTYNKEEDCYICKNGVKLSLRGIQYNENSSNVPKKIYKSKVQDCKYCVCKTQCCKRYSFKELQDSYHKPYYDAAYKRINTKQGKQKMRLRSSTVEPVWGTLINFMKMKKVYTKGNQLAHKQLLMASTAYNLKKLMKFVNPKFVAKEVKYTLNDLKTTFLCFKTGGFNIFNEFFILLRAKTSTFTY
jgi:transposase